MACTTGTGCNLKTTTNKINSATNNPNRVFFCADKLAAVVKRNINYIAGVAGVLVFFQLVSLFSASRLACCISVKDGGHMARRDVLQNTFSESNAPLHCTHSLRPGFSFLRSALLFFL